MGNMQKDGVSGYVSEYVDTDRVVDDRPTDAPFVRITHFPYDEFHVDHDAVESGEWASSETGLPTIPLGQAYETTIWDGRDDIRDAYIAVNGVEDACHQALDVAEEHDLPIWDTILRLRPRTVVVERTPMQTVSGEYATAVRELDDDDWIAIGRDTGLGAWGPSKDDALETLEERRDWYAQTDTRSGEIVQTEDTLGGAPRVDGSRIGVLHILNTYEQTESIPETAARFVGPLTIDEVKTALDWADANPETIEELREQREQLRREQTLTRPPSTTNDGSETDHDD